MEEIPVSRLGPAENRTPRNRTARRRYREERFREYFRNAGDVVFPRGEVEILDGCRLAGPDEPFKPGTVTGINRGKDTCAPGLLFSRPHDRLVVRTPLRNKNVITRIIGGDIDLSFLL